MSPKISILLATSLLAAALSGLPHPSANPVGRGDGNPPARSEHRGEPSPVLSKIIPDSPSTKSEPFNSTSPVTGRSTGPAPEYTGLTGIDAPDENQPVRNHSGKSTPSESASPVTPVERTIQLANNFRLPAALLSRSFTPTEPKPAAVENITRQIEDTFYRKLGSNRSESPETVAADSNVDPNVVIEPDEESIQVLDHADQLYRSMFGQEAFNRQSLNSAIEVRLPATDTAVSN